MSLSNSRIDVALATYNGARFLKPFLDSLLAQTHRNFGLVVADDGSTDQTVPILEAYADRLDIRFLGSQRKGVVGNFERALAGCTADYITPADQDDIWRPQKLETLLGLAQGAEAATGPGAPVLVFSDLALVAEDLTMISPSFFDATLKTGEARAVEDFVLDNHVPGCATLVNRALLNLALPFPRITIHDWWLNLLAASGGVIEVSPLSLVEYRQHGGNAIGIGNANAGGLAKVGRALSKPFDFASTRIADARKRAEDAGRQLVAIERRLRERECFAAADRLRGLLGSSRPALFKTFLAAKTGLRTPDVALTTFFLDRRARSDASSSEGSNAAKI